MKINNKKIIAFFLSLFVIITYLPINILAIDASYNILSEKNAENENYLSEIIVEEKSLREENVKHYKMPDGTYTAVVYNKAIHRKDSNGVWQDIDNRMNEVTLNNKQAYITSDERTMFSKKINSEDSTIFELSENGYTIKTSFSNSNIQNTTAKLSNHATKYVPTKSDDIETQYKKIKQIDNNTTVSYKNLLKGITLEYVLSANDIKENIIVEKTNEKYEYSFIYELTGLVALLNDDGSISLIDEITQYEVYNMPAPYMYDANGEKSYDVSYSLTNLRDGSYSLTILADEEWINDTERVFPVVIDPTIQFDASYWDTYINSVSPDTNYGYSDELWISSTKTAFIDYEALPTLPGNATISRVTLNLYYYYYITTGSLDVGLYYAMSDWEEDTLTWNSANTTFLGMIAPIKMGSATLPASTTITETSPGLAAIDVTEIVKNWYAGRVNYGMVLKYEGGSNGSVILNSWDANDGFQSYYEITYSIATLVVNTGTYYIQNAQYDNYMQIDNNASTNEEGAILELWDFDGASDQKWKVKYLNNGYYKIISSQNGKAITAPSDTNDSLTLKNYSASNYQMWKITSAGGGMYKLSPKSNNSYYMAAGEGLFVSDGRNVEMRSLQSDNKDEWIICGFDTSLLLAINDSDGSDRHDYFSSTKSNLQTQKNGTVSVVSTARYSSLSITQMINYLKSKNIFFVHTHGYQQGFKISNSGTCYITLTDLSGEDLSNLSFALLMTCETGKNYSITHITNNTPVNIIEQMVICGAETVVGFKDITKVSDCNEFGPDLTYQLIINGRSVEDAINKIDYSSYVNNMANIAVIAGNGNKKLR